MMGLNIYSRKVSKRETVNSLFDTERQNFSETREFLAYTELSQWEYNCCRVETGPVIK